MFASVLIANRGEIVARIARTAQRLGIATVAIASDADRGAPFTAACDQLVAIGGEHARRLLPAHRQDHRRRDVVGRRRGPSRLRLPQRARRLRRRGRGGRPRLDRPAAGGDARDGRQGGGAPAHATTAGVPILPGYDGAAQDAATLRAEAKRIGYPLMVKAVAGGGGRGMRLVASEAELDAALASAAAEANSAFGDARLLLERAVERARHVEIQVFADSHGNVIHLGERDCSLQRRHQKLVEEAPSPAVTPELRRRMGEVAVAVARAVDYRGAGTVEFLLDAAGDFRFIEMNTRLQVEHAVTEAVLGVDLVEWQLRVAAGEALPWTQDEALQRYERGGHAIEARLCAEDPAQGYLPQSGRIARWRAPPGVRTDHALADGAAVPPFYDSMLARVIATRVNTRRIARAARRRARFGRLLGRDDESCVPRPRRARRRVRRRRVRHDLPGAPFRRRRGALDPGADVARSDRRRLAGLAAARAAAAAVVGLVFVAVHRHARCRSRSTASCNAGVWPDRASLWTPLAPSRRIASPGCRNASMTARRPSKPRVDGRAVRVAALVAGDVGHWQAEGSELAAVDLRLRGGARAAAASSGTLVAPMHGRVTEACVEAGATVAAGALLVVIEAMKMEHQIRAPHAGTIAALHVRAGDQVAVRQPLVEVRA